MFTTRTLRSSWPALFAGVLSLGGGGCDRPRSPTSPAPMPKVSQASPVFWRGDRVAWVGSSSTQIGIWPRTMEFLLRTRHPALDLQFRTFGIGGATFQVGAEKLDRWMDEYHPDVVFFNYGVNDSGRDEAGLAQFKENIERCLAKVEARGARAILITPQAADVRRSGPRAAARRTLYAETMLSYGRGQGWTVIDIHHPLDLMQRATQQANPSYTILRDPIHLTAPAYVAWGFFLFDGLDLPFVRSAATLTSEGSVTSTENCTIKDVVAGKDVLSFTRSDKILPILPPGPLPPRYSVPLEAHSRYLLTVTGLLPGEYEIRCEGQPIASVHTGALAAGVNLNSLLLDRGREAPWSKLATAIWEGRTLDRIGSTAWKFEVRKQP